MPLSTPRKRSRKATITTTKISGLRTIRSPCSIQPATPASLIGTTLAVTPTDPTWGSTITVTAQITNESSGSSPQTRALLSLSPQGLSYGGSTTVGIGNIIVPPLGPYQTVNLVQNITLPAVEPSAIANYTNFGLTMVQDADYLTNDLYPNQPDQGIGLDQAAISITTSPTSTATVGTLPDLAASSVLLSRSSVNWGSSIQATTEIQNLGAGRRPRVQGLLRPDRSDRLAHRRDLPGPDDVPALASGASQQVTQTLQLPVRLPSGRDARQCRLRTHRGSHQSRKRRSTSPSIPTVARCLSRSSCGCPAARPRCPTAKAAGTLPSIQALAIQTQNKAKVAAAEKLAAKVAARNATKPAKKLHRKVGKGGLNVAKASLSVGEEITKLPNQVYDAIKRSI